MKTFFCANNPFLWIAIFFALIYGSLSVFIFVKPDIYKKQKWYWWLHQIWFNACGAFIGWFALYYVWETDINNFKIEHFVSLIVAFLGITGYLPYAALIGKIWKKGDS